MQRYCILFPCIGQGLDSTKTQWGRTCFSALVPDCVPYRFPISSCTLFASPVANTFLEAVKCTLLLSLVKHQELGVFQASECVCVSLWPQRAREIKALRVCEHQFIIKEMLKGFVLSPASHLNGAILLCPECVLLELPFIPCLTPLHALCLSPTVLVFSRFFIFFFHALFFSRQCAYQCDKI